MSRPKQPESGGSPEPATPPRRPPAPGDEASAHRPRASAPPEAAPGAGDPEAAQRAESPAAGGGERGAGGGGGASAPPGSGGGGDRPVEVAIVSIGALGMWRRLGWAVAVLGLLAAFVWVAILVPIVSVPLLISFIIAYLLAPIVDRLETWGLNRTLGIAIIVLAFLGLMSGAVAIVVPLVADDVRRMPAQLAELFESASAWIEATFGLHIPRTGDEIMEAITSWLDELEDAETWLGSVAQVVFGRTVSAMGMLLGFLMIPVFSFFLLRDFRKIFALLRSLVPDAHRPVVVQRVGEIDSALGGFIRGQLIVAGILAVMYSIGLWLVGLPLAILVGVIAGLGNMVPYLGTAIGLLIATIVALLDWQGFVQLLLVYGVFAGVQALESWLITPNIVGNRVGLSPFGVIVAVLAFGELFGFLGVLLAVPIAAVIKILLRATIASYRQSSFFERTGS